MAGVYFFLGWLSESACNMAEPSLVDNFVCSASTPFIVPAEVDEPLMRKFYDKIVPFVDDAIQQFAHAVPKPPFDQIKDHGYLFTTDRDPTHPLPDFQSCDKLELYGLHTYGGYYGFFRPDLTEVIGLLSEYITEDALDNIEKIYVTTEPSPSDNIAECFDYAADRHKGVTKAFVVMKK